MEVIHSGQHNGNSKINNSIVREIRESDLTDQELAEKYNVNKITIRGVRLGKTWKHVK